MKIENLNPEGLVPYENNAKIHTQEKIDKLAKVIADQGWQGNPIIIRKADSVIISGHGRRLAALKLGLEAVPVYQADVTEEQANAIRLSDNRVAFGDYDEEMLKEELMKLAEFDIDMTDLGFDPGEIDIDIDMSEIDAMLAGIDDVDEEDTSEVSSVDRPELKEVDYSPTFSVYVEGLSGEEEQEKLYEEMTERGYTCRVLTS